MRKAFVILYAGEKRQLQSATDRTVGEERMAFEALKIDGLPKGVDRAEYHDSDLRGSFLTLGGVDLVAAHEAEVKRVATIAEQRRKDRAAAPKPKAVKSPKAAPPKPK